MALTSRVLAVSAARRLVTVLAILLPFALASLTACSALLGLRDIEEGASGADAFAASDDRGGMVTGSEAASSNDGAATSSDARDAEAAADSGVTGFCAPFPTALVCEDFESGQFSTKWQLVQQGTKPFATVVARNGAVDGGANQHEGFFGFNPIPDIGVSALAIQLASGRRSLRFAMRTSFSGWPASGVGLARMVDANGKGITLSAAQPTGTGPYKFIVHADDADGGNAFVADLGFGVSNVWTCLEIELANDGTLRGWQGTAPTVGSVSASLATRPLEAQIGMMWDSLPNGGSKNVEIDDVVVGTGMVGCPP